MEIPEFDPYASHVRRHDLTDFIYRYDPSLIIPSSMKVQELRDLVHQRIQQGPPSTPISSSGRCRRSNISTRTSTASPVTNDTPVVSPALNKAPTVAANRGPRMTSSTVRARRSTSGKIEPCLKPLDEGEASLEGNPPPQRTPSTPLVEGTRRVSRAATRKGKKHSLPCEAEEELHPAPAVNSPNNAASSKVVSKKQGSNPTEDSPQAKSQSPNKGNPSKTCKKSEAKPPPTTKTVGPVPGLVLDLEEQPVGKSMRPTRIEDFDFSKPPFSQHNPFQESLSSRSISGKKVDKSKLSAHDYQLPSAPVASPLAKLPRTQPGAVHKKYPKEMGLGSGLPSAFELQSQTLANTCSLKMDKPPQPCHSSTKVSKVTFQVDAGRQLEQAPEDHFDLTPEIGLRPPIEPKTSFCKKRDASKIVPDLIGFADTLDGPHNHSLGSTPKGSSAVPNTNYLEGSPKASVDLQPSLLDCGPNVLGSARMEQALLDDSDECHLPIPGSFFETPPNHDDLVGLQWTGSGIALKLPLAPLKSGDDNKEDASVSFLNSLLNRVPVPPTLNHLAQQREALSKVSEFASFVDDALFKLRQPRSSYPEARKTGTMAEPPSPESIYPPMPTTSSNLLDHFVIVESSQEIPSISYSDSSVSKEDGDPVSDNPATMSEMDSITPSPQLEHADNSVTCISDSQDEDLSPELIAGNSVHPDEVANSPGEKVQPDPGDGAHTTPEEVTSTNNNFPLNIPMSQRLEGCASLDLMEDKETISTTSVEAPIAPVPANTCSGVIDQDMDNLCPGNGDVLMNDRAGAGQVALTPEDSGLSILPVNTANIDTSPKEGATQDSTCSANIANVNNPLEKEATQTHLTIEKSCVGLPQAPKLIPIPAEEPPIVFNSSDIGVNLLEDALLDFPGDL